MSKMLNRFYTEQEENFIEKENRIKKENFYSTEIEEDEKDVFYLKRYTNNLNRAY